MFKLLFCSVLLVALHSRSTNSAVIVNIQNDGEDVNGYVTERELYNALRRVKYEILSSMREFYWRIAQQNRTEVIGGGDQVVITIPELVPTGKDSSEESNSGEEKPKKEKKEKKPKGLPGTIG